MAVERNIKQTFNFKSEAEIQKHFKTVDSRVMAAATLQQSVDLMKKAAENLQSDLRKLSQRALELNLEPRVKRAAAVQQATDAANRRFQQRREAIITARDHQLERIERQQFLPVRPHAEKHQEERFQSWADDKRGQLKERHKAERDKLDERQQWATKRLDAKLTAEHGPKKEALQRKLNQIEAKGERSGRLVAAMYWASGLQAKDKAHSKSINAEIRQIDSKIAAEKDGLRTRHEGQKREEENQHSREASQLEDNITIARELSEGFSFAASDRYLTLSEVFNFGADGQGIGAGADRISFGRGREGQDSGPGLGIDL